MTDNADNTDNAGSSADRRRMMLDRIRTGLNDGTPMRARTTAVAARLAGQKPHLIPERAQQDAAGRKTMFAAHLTGQTATVLDVAALEDVPSAVATYLRGQNLPQRLRVGADPDLANMPWSNEPPPAVTKVPWVSRALLVTMLMIPFTALAPHTLAPGPRMTSIRSMSCNG